MSIIKGKPGNLSRSCEKHGNYEAKCQEIFNDRFVLYEDCPTCIAEESKAFEAEKEKRAALQAEERKQQEQERIDRQKRYAGVKARHQGSTFENFEASTQQQSAALTKTRDFMQKVIKREGGNLVMCGRVGTGKTHLAAAMAHVMVERDRACKLIKLPELMRLIKGSWSGEGMSESELIDLCSKVELLIIDEVGVQYGSDTEKLIVSEIIDNRYQDMLPTVLISNLDIQGIKSCIGERCYDRLKEDGGTVVAFDWDSHRGSVAPVERTYQPTKTTRRKPLPRPEDES